MANSKKGESKEEQENYEKMKQVSEIMENAKKYLEGVKGKLDNCKKVEEENNKLREELNETQEKLNKALNEIEKLKKNAIEEVSKIPLDYEQNKLVCETINDAENLAREEFKKGKSLVDVKKSMNNIFEKALQGIKNFGENMWKKIQKIFDAFVKGIEKTWNKVFGKEKAEKRSIDKSYEEKHNGIENKNDEIETIKR